MGELIILYQMDLGIQLCIFHNPQRCFLCKTQKAPLSA
nr:MAG TPA: hypothetical protein [Caudoviricetes sp.]